MKDYQKRMTLPGPAEKIYEAITLHIPAWWSHDFSGAGVKPGDRFDIAFGETRKTFEITEAIPAEKIKWTCVKAYIDMPSLKNKAEWEGTTMTWTITGSGANTFLDFLHEGLNRDMECYEVCEQGWDYFLASLETYMLTGKGNPYTKK